MQSQESPPPSGLTRLPPEKATRLEQLALLAPLAHMPALEAPLAQVAQRAGGAQLAQVA